MFVDKDPLGNPVDRRHPWNQHTNPAAAEARLRRQVQLGHVAPLVRRHRSPRARHRRRSASRGCGRPRCPVSVDIGYVKATGSSVQINLPRTALKPEKSFEWKIPQWSNTIERNRARTYFQAYAAAAPCTSSRRPSPRCAPGTPRRGSRFKVPDEAIGCGFTEAVRGVLSHHMVIKGGKIANYHPYPPTPWNANPRDTFGTPGPYEDAVMGPPIFEENELRGLQGHRHHANRPQLRSVPAVRRAHVPRQGQGAEPGALAHAMHDQAGD